MRSFAVALSTYNGVQYLQEMLDSIRLQTVQPDRVYIRDDHSSDNTVEMIIQYIARHGLSNWSVFVNEKNTGWKQNFHDLLLGVREDYVFLADQDDIWMPDKLESMMNAAERDPAISLLVCDYEPFYMDDTQRVTHKITDTIKDDGAVVKIGMTETFQNVLRPGCTFLVSTEFLKTIEPYWNTRIAHDAVIWRFAVLTEGAYSLRRKLIKWRRYSSSTSNPDTFRKNYGSLFKMRYELVMSGSRSHLDCYDSMMEFCRDHDVPERNRAILEKSIEFETEYLRSMEKRSVASLINVGRRYRSFFLSSKTLPASIVWALLGR